MVRICIEGGLLCDGMPRPTRQADVLVENGSIAAVGHGFENAEALHIDARGCIITPGFVDMHRHCDTEALHGEGFGRIELSQGITTAVAGNCGLSPAPVSARGEAQAFYDYIEPVTGMPFQGDGRAQLGQRYFPGHCMH